MKKVITVLIVCLVMLFCSGCKNVDVEKIKTNGVSMFVIVEVGDCWVVVYHKETKVMYAVSYGGYNAGTFTLMVDKDGKPLLWQGE